MENLKWRIPSRIVAVLDLIILGFGILVIILNIYLDVVNQEYTGATDPKTERNEITSVMWIVIVLACCFVFLVILLTLWAILMLLKATKKGTDHVEAARWARIWLNVNKAFFCFTLLNFLRTTHYASMVGGLVIRVILMFIVYKFIQELDQVNSTLEFNNPENMVVNL